jgi:hypothetical protein
MNQEFPMTTTPSRRAVLTAACLLAAGPAARADHLIRVLPAVYTSAYSEDPLRHGARQVTVQLTFEGDGSGSAVLRFDPSRREGSFSTLREVRDVRARFRLIHDDHHAPKGRRVYELTEAEGKGSVREMPDEHWLLVTPAKAGAPCSLLFVDKDGKVQDVLMLE